MLVRTLPVAGDFTHWLQHKREFNASGRSGVWCFPGGSHNKETIRYSGDPVSIPELGRSPGEGNATHSSILAWRIPWTEEPGGLPSMGPQRVRQD